MTRRAFAAVAGSLWLLLALTPPATAAPDDSVLDTSALYALLDVIDAVMAANPDAVAEKARIDALDGEARAAALAEKRAANARNEAITSRIDALLATPAYQLYFRQYRFTKPDTHRNILLSLPYEAARGPSDVSSNLLALCSHRDEVRRWVDEAVSRIDPEACAARAAEWLPPGDYHPVPVRFIYDGNGDAFSSFGGIVFDIYSVALRERPEATRFTGLSAADTERIERVIAHEYHHAFARSLPHMPEPDSPREAREQRLAARMVSEGVAMQCDVGPGLRRDVMEDAATVSWWIHALNEKLAATEAGTLDDAAWNEWLQSTWSDLAMERLRDYFARTRPGEDPERLARINGAARPMLVYTLGWHMIRRILAEPDGKARVLSLLESPHRLFAEYDRTLGENDGAARVATVY